MPIEGYVSMNVLKVFYKAFTWVFLGNGIKDAAIKDKKIKAFFNLLSLETFREATISESAILLYIYLQKRVNIRELESSRIVSIGGGKNKLLEEKDFVTKELYTFYMEADADIDKEFLLFNSSYNRVTNTPITTTIKSHGAVNSAVRKYELALNSLPYKLVNKTLLIKDSAETSEKGELIILQDCTYSMSSYKGLIFNIRAAILNKAVEEGIKVIWAYVSNKVVDINIYDSNALSGLTDFVLDKETRVELSGILCSDLCKGKKVVVITDGTDDFDFEFESKATEINFIYFKKNVKLLNKITSYGRTFRFK